MMEGLVVNKYIVVADRAYFKISRCDQYQKEKQAFVIRIKSNADVCRKKNLKCLPTRASHINADYTCLVGTSQNRSGIRHRILEFKDYEGKSIRVITNLMHIDAEIVAQIYKERWAIEVFFKWLKQQMNLATIFGSRPNAVYNQLYGAIIAYVILHGIYVAMNRTQKVSSLTFCSIYTQIVCEFIAFAVTVFPPQCYFVLPKFWLINTYVLMCVPVSIISLYTEPYYDGKAGKSHILYRVIVVPINLVKETYKILGLDKRKG